MKNAFLAVFTALSLAQLAFMPASVAQSTRVLAPDFVDLVEKASPAVVNIRTTEQRAAPQQAQGGLPPGIPEEQAEFFRRFFGVPPRAPLNLAHLHPGNPAKQSVELALGSLLIPPA